MKKNYQQNHSLKYSDIINEIVSGCTVNIFSSFYIETNECEIERCMNGGTCVDELNGYHCICPPGYTGPNCRIGMPIISFSILAFKIIKCISSYLYVWLNVLSI